MIYITQNTKETQTPQIPGLNSGALEG